MFHVEQEYFSNDAGLLMFHVEQEYFWNQRGC